MTHGIGVQGASKLVKNRKQPHFASLPQTNPSPESKNFFFNTTKKSSRIGRGFELLSSYSGWRVITKKPRAHILALVGVKGLKICATTQWQLSWIRNNWTFSESLKEEYIINKVVLQMLKYEDHALCICVDNLEN